MMPSTTGRNWRTVGSRRRRADWVRMTTMGAEPIAISVAMLTDASWTPAK